MPVCLVAGFKGLKETKGDSGAKIARKIFDSVPARAKNSYFIHRESMRYR